MLSVEMKNLVVSWIDEVESLVIYWDSMSNTGLGLTVLIALLSFFLPVLSQLSKRNCWNISIIIGMTIGVTTVFLNKVVEYDYRVYAKYSTQGSDILQEMKYLYTLTNETIDPNNLRTLLVKIREYRSKATHLDQNNFGKGNDVSLLDRVILPAYSDSFLGDIWTITPPINDNKFYFKGSSIGYLLDNVISSSEMNAEKNYIDFIKMHTSVAYESYGHKEFLSILQKDKQKIFVKSKNKFEVHTLYYVNKSDLLSTGEMINNMFLFDNLPVNWEKITSIKQKTYMTRPVSPYEEMTVNRAKEFIQKGVKILERYELILANYENTLREISLIMNDCGGSFRSAENENFYILCGERIKESSIILKNLATKLDNLEARIIRLSKNIRLAIKIIQESGSAQEIKELKEQIEYVENFLKQ